MSDFFPFAWEDDYTGRLVTFWVFFLHCAKFSLYMSTKVTVLQREYL